MRHQAKDVEAIIRDARDRAHRAVRIRRLGLNSVIVNVTKQYLPPLFHLREFLGRRDVTAFAVLDGQPQDFAGVSGAREGRAGITDADINDVADEAERSIAHQRAGEQMRLAENLKAVADADHEATVRG